jgi:hypothetical protein
VTPTIARAIEVARMVRDDLLSRRGVSRDLAGQCGIASMLVAVELDDPRVLRTGFYMKRGRFCGRCGRFPHRHAWCQVGDTIVDLTATQFGRHRAVHVVHVLADDCYVETADDADAIDDILDNWRGRELPEYRKLAQRLRS